MSDVAQWLEAMGLARYAQIFAENDVDFDVLPDLEESDLEKLGISLGHRKKILREIAALAGETSPRSDAVEPKAGSEPISPQVETQVEAERRQLTVMFVDLVGSTALSGKLDPEDLSDIIRAYQNAVAGEIARFEGHVAKFMGDGILAYFGWPRAHENEAERAARAALAVIDAVGGLRVPDGDGLSVRIGIATGIVVVGDLVGKGAAQEEAVIGETPNLAARLQGVAEPGQIILSETTRRLLGDLFELFDLGPLSLKGIPAPARAWRVLREGGVDSRYEAHHASGAMPLVGRQEELGLLLRSWEISKDGHGQVVLIQGEAGIGKSRLVTALRDHVAGESHIWVGLQCAPHHASSTLYPVKEHLKRLMGWTPEDDRPTRLDKLEAALETQSLRLEESVPLFAELMALPLPEGRYAPLDLSAQEKRELTLDALTTWLLEEAERKPLIAVWEDLHWADPTTLDLLMFYIDQSPTVSMMNVITYRPDFVPPWPTRSHMTTLTLSRLERPEIEALIKHQARGKLVPLDVVEHIVGKTDGVPLFVEELTKSILRSDFLREGADRYTLVGSLAEVSIPATLQESLLARLDRLPQVRELAQLGAVVGREFAYEMLLHLGSVDEPVLQEGLRQLVDDEILYQRGRPPRARYIFKHALIQDAAYQLLLKRTRKRYHHQVACLLEERFPETVEAHPELVAHHYAEAGSTEEAVAYLQRAGRKAFERSANIEAVSHFEKGMKLLHLLPAASRRDEQELELQMGLGPALVAAHGFTDRRVGQAYERAWQLCQRLADTTRLPLVLRGMEVFHYVRGELNEARNFADRLRDLAERQQDPALLVGAYHALVQTFFSLGELVAAHEAAEQGTALFDTQKHRLANWPGGQPGEQCYLYGGFALWTLGYPDQAIRQSEQALVLATELANRANLINTLVFVAVVHALRRDHSAVRQRAEEAVEMCADQGSPFFRAYGTVLRGWARAQQGQVGDGIAEIEQGITAYRALNAQTWVPLLLALKADSCARAGHTRDALATVDEALELMEITEERCWQSEFCRMKGQLFMAMSAENGAHAERFLSRGLDIARAQKAKSWELRCTVSLGRLWQRQGKTDAARSLIAPVYNWFTEGLETADLREAKALLDELI